MMRKLFITSTLVFWIAVAGFWAATILLPKPFLEGGSVAASDKDYTLAELATHDQADDCWMAIDGVVYDFTAYLPQHPPPQSSCSSVAVRKPRRLSKPKPRGGPILDMQTNCYRNTEWGSCEPSE